MGPSDRRARDRRWGLAGDKSVTYLRGTHCEIAMLKSPGGGSRLELSSFITPDHVPGSRTATAVCGWPTCAGPRGSSSPCSSRSP